MNESLALFFELGTERVTSHIAQLATTIVEWANSRPDVSLVTPADATHRAGIVCLRPRDSEEASQRLKEKGVAHSFREGNIRLAPHIYNTHDEVCAALDLME